MVLLHSWESECLTDCIHEKVSAWPNFWQYLEPVTPYFAY